MAYARVNHNAVILPNGHVFVVGGTARVDSNSQAVLQPEMWLPDEINGSGVRGLWKTSFNGENLANLSLRRGYHSTAILLPDGRVLSGGGNNDSTHQTKVQIYCPPYLFDANGNLASRPRIHSTAKGPMAINPYAHMSYGQQLAVCVEGATGNLDSLKAVLMAPGMTTHGFDQNQRRVPLEVDYCGEGTRVQITGPPNANHAPPGYYLMFLLNASGVPSVAEWVKVGGDSVSTMAPSCNTCSGSGCPYVDVRTAEGWLTENTLLGRSLGGDLAYDAYRLKLTPSAADGSIRLRLRENEQEVTTLDEARLLVVDHTPGFKVMGSGNGVVAGNWTPAWRVTTARGEDITSLVNGSQGSTGWQGSSGDTVLVGSIRRRSATPSKRSRTKAAAARMAANPRSRTFATIPATVADPRAISPQPPRCSPPIPTGCARPV